jgi:hypothetical protein
VKEDDPFAADPNPAPTPQAARKREPDPFADDRKLIQGDASPPMRVLLVDADVARASLGISRTTLDLLVRSGELRCRRIRGRVLFSVDVLERFARGEDGKE